MRSAYAGFSAAMVVSVAAHATVAVMWPRVELAVVKRPPMQLTLAPPPAPAPPPPVPVPLAGPAGAAQGLPGTTAASAPAPESASPRRRSERPAPRRRAKPPPPRDAALANGAPSPDVRSNAPTTEPERSVASAAPDDPAPGAAPGPTTAEVGGEPRGPARDPGSGGDGRRVSYAAYLHSVRDRLAGHRRYPYSARRLGLAGTIRVRFRIDAAGRVTAISFVDPGPHDLLRTASMETIRASEPLPSPPADLGDSVRVEVPIVFRLEVE